MEVKDIKVGQVIKFGINVRNGVKNLKGKVYSVNTHHFTVQFDNFRESFMPSDIVTEVVLCKI